MEPNRPDPTLKPVRAVTLVTGRLKLLAMRYRLGRWAAAGAAATIAAGLLAMGLADVRSARSEWGTSVEVVRTRAELEAGDVVTSAAVELTVVPTGLVPAGAVTRPPVGRRVTTSVGVGEILVERRLASRPGSASSLALPEGTRGVLLERSQVFGEAGDTVALHALASGAELAEAVIVHTGESSVTVAVPTLAVAAVVDAISQGGVVSVLVP